MMKGHRQESTFTTNRYTQGVQDQYPSLQFFTESGKNYLRGSFPLESEGRILDRFVIEIELPERGRDTIPAIREIGGRIPRIVDNHINPNGDICLFVPDERWRVFPRGATLLDFLNGPVRNYFLGYCLKEAGEDWPFGERHHGKSGIIEYYEEVVGTNNQVVIKKYLEVLSSKNLKGHWKCPCLSGKKIRDCHQSQLEDLRQKIDRSAAEKSLSYFQSP
jgi:hypothetical protein